MKKWLLYLILTLAALTFLYPFVWMVSASLTPERDIGSLVLFPSSLTAASYVQMWERIPIGRSLLNSLLVASLVTGGVLVFGSMVGYALARMRFRGRNLIFYIILFTMTLPFQITLIPNYILMVELHWVDTYWALVVPYLINALSIVLFRQYFATLPQDLIDAARIDGCGELRILFQILWPNAVPALVTVGIITFMATWNEVLWPLLVVRDQQLMTMPQLVTLFAVGGRADAQLGVKLAAATLLALPIVVAYVFFQKYFIQSMASTGIKD
ncbi:multiple sugar transport system permease protein [Catalinimonas alkaloidigena]|uniref:sn-glycerol-3-phosphate transport system permease protein UgpE n=1 Tax=Catalinimonas alkaloidigena TaxID=1075417 RepID=A0A1G9E912_9BACT|nr:carbohydrate ABC transporter permease [Catalinimonas alkaloidigena]SDK72525.1 multiple sugar transport system permease protein [Catalinimonas alkaloidigena]